MVSSRHVSLTGAVQSLAHEVAKFGVVGLVAFVVTTALSNLFHFGLHIGPITSFGLATVVAAVGSYFANRHWTWSERERNGLRRELSIFMLLSAVGLGLSELPVGFTEYVLKQHSGLWFNASTTIVGTGIGTVWRFWSFRRWVFLEAEPLRTEDAAHEALV